MFNGNEIFLFDSDVLIKAKNFHYNASYCDAFWSWLKNGVETKKFQSITHVKKEWEKGDAKDFLCQKIESGFFNDFWIDNSSIDIIAQWTKVQNWAKDDWAKGKNPASCRVALESFAHANSADSWLVAVASTFKTPVVIVTDEVSAIRSQSNVKLPDAANAFNIKTCSLFKVLSHHACDTFKFKGQT
jgi:hypothetical protein